MSSFMFTVPGEPGSKGRPKFSTRGGFVRAITPEKTVNYENLVKSSFIQAYPIWKPFEKDVQLYVTIIACFSIPKSTSKKKTEQMIHGYIRPTKKPDTDNVAKIICDSLNQMAYYDDSQIVELRVAKYYSAKPEVRVVISDVKEE